MDPRKLAKMCDSIFESKSSSISVMVLGAPAIGKSTLANSLLGQKIADESEPGVITECSVTKSVIRYEKIVDGSVTRVYDTPGLMDPSSRIEIALHDISMIIGSVDLILFCIDMTDTRFIQGNNVQTIIRALTESLGSLIWIKTVFVLVRANMAIDSIRTQFKPNQEFEVKQAFEQKIRNWKKILTKEMEEDLDINIVATGHYSKPKLFENDRVYWLSNFWEICFFSLNTIDSRAALFKVNIGRIKERDQVKFNCESHDQHIIMSPGFQATAEVVSPEVLPFLEKTVPSMLNLALIIATVCKELFLTVKT